MSNENAPWFRLRGDKWKADTRGLSLQEKAIFMDLLVEMHEREEPLSDDWLDQVRSITRTRPSTFYPAIKRLVSLGLFVRIDDGLWSKFMDGEIENRQKRSDKARRSSEKSRRKSAQNPKNQQGKSQQNQRSSSAIHTDTYTEAPKGASGDRDNPKREDFDNEGASSAYAGSPHTGGDEPPSFNSEVEEQPEWLVEIPLPKSPDDYLDCGVSDDQSIAGGNRTDNDASAEHHRLVVRCRKDEDGLSPSERDLLKDLQRKLDGGADLTIAETDELQNIASYLDISDDGAEDAGWPQQNANSPQKEAHR